MSTMADTLTVDAEPGGLTMIVTREFDAPSTLVYEAMTDREAIPRWWGPAKYSTVVEEMDVRVGGHWRFRQSDEEGTTYVFFGEYREVVPGERIVQTFQFDGAPGEVAVETMTLDERDGRTVMRVVSEFSSVEARDAMLDSGAEAGMRESYERLDAILSADSGHTANDLVIERIFEAPRELVWRAWTEPEHLARWYGPDSYTAVRFDIDLRVGGRYLWGLRSPEGGEYWTTGVYREVVIPERFVATGALSDEHGNLVPPSHYGMPDGMPSELVIAVDLEDLGGRTRMTLRHSGWTNDEMAAGAAGGWNQAFDKLAATFAETA